MKEKIHIYRYREETSFVFLFPESPIHLRYYSITDKREGERINEPERECVKESGREERSCEKGQL